MCSWEVNLSHGDMTVERRKSRRTCFDKLNLFLYLLSYLGGGVFTATQLLCA